MTSHTFRPVRRRSQANSTAARNSRVPATAGAVLATGQPYKRTLTNSRTALRTGVSMEYGILGPVRVRDGATEIVLDGAKPRTVLAALLLAEGSVVADTGLSWFLWGGRPPATLTAQLYNHVSRVRRALGPEAGIARRAHGYE